MGLAKLVDAPVLLAGDIDRGGVFAQLYGTVALLEPDERARICGLIINKFRGDVEILRPGLAMLEEKTQLPVLGVVPYLKVDIEDEDPFPPAGCGQSGPPAGCGHPPPAAHLQLYRFHAAGAAPAAGRAVCAEYPPAGHTGSHHPCPAPKNTVDDLLWLRQSGLERSPVEAGRPTARRCWGSAAGIRCWARHWPTLRARRAARRRPCGGWGCCPPAQSLPARSTAPRTLPP